MNIRRWSVRLALVAASLLLSCAGLEVGLRLFSPVPPSWAAIYAEHPRLPYALAPNSHCVVDTGVTHWEVRTDSLGLRIGSKGHVPRDRPHWLAIGDSFAFGHGVDADLGLVGRLEVETGVPIANAAVPGFGPTQYAQMLAEHIDRPGLTGVVVVAYLGNDFHDVHWDKTTVIHDGILGLQPGLKGAIKRNSQLYRFASSIAHRMGIGAPSSAARIESDLMDPVVWTERLDASRPFWMSSFREMQVSCTERGIPMVVVLIPNLAAVDDAVRERAIARANPSHGELNAGIARARAMEWLTALGLECVDTADVLKGMEGERWLPFDGHLTPHANAQVARSVAHLVAASLTDSK